MSSISSIGGAGGGWSTGHVHRQPPSQQRLFDKVDSDGDGGVSATEFESMVSDISAKTGNTLGDSAELFSQMDGDGDGSLSSSELQEGMKSLMPPPPSTMAFAQSRGAGGESDGDDLFSMIDADGNGSLSSDEVQALVEQASSELGTDMADQLAEKLAALDTDGDGALSTSEFKAGHSEGPPPPGPPPMAGAGGAGGTSGTDSTNNTQHDPLDTNEDGVVSQMERLAGELQKLYDQISQSSDSAVSSSVGTTLSLAA